MQEKSFGSWALPDPLEELTVLPRPSLDLMEGKGQGKEQDGGWGWDEMDGVEGRRERRRGRWGGRKGRSDGMREGGGWGKRKG